jgi:hypothetical protein
MKTDMTKLTEEDYVKIAELSKFLAGAVHFCMKEGYDVPAMAQIVKTAAEQYSEKTFGENHLSRWSGALVKSANGMGGLGGGTGDLGSPNSMAPAGTDPNMLAKQQQGPNGAGNVEDPEDAALRAKPVPTNPFDFKNHPAILQMQKRQKDLLKAKKKELEQAQNHTTGLF